jgi:hypothetical protein
MVSSGAHDRSFSVSSKETHKETSVPEFDGGKFPRHPYIYIHLLNGNPALLSSVDFVKQRVINSLNFQPRVPLHRQGAAP